MSDSKKKCPEGHRLPRKSATGLPCSVLFCADASLPPTQYSKTKKTVDVGGRVTRSKARIQKAIGEQADLPEGKRVELASLVADDALPGDGGESPEEYEAAREGIIEERSKLARGNAGLQVRRKVVPVPAGLTGQEADDFVSRRQTELAPHALAEIEHQLLYSVDADKRYRAAKDILDGTGHGKQEKGVGGSSPIIILTGGAVMNPPWAQPQVSKPQTVEALPQAPKRVLPAVPPDVQSKE